MHHMHHMLTNWVYAERYILVFVIDGCGFVDFQQRKM